MLPAKVPPVGRKNLHKARLEPPLLALRYLFDLAKLQLEIFRRPKDSGLFDTQERLSVRGLLTELLVSNLETDSAARSQALKGAGLTFCKQDCDYANFTKI